MRPGVSRPNITDDDPSVDFRNDPFFSPGASGGMGTSADERFWDVYYTTSDDGGRSWSTNTRVTNPSVDGRLGVTFNNNDVRGPMGIASTADAAYLAWSDSRATGPQAQEAEDVYLSRVRFAAPGPLGGDEGGSEVWWVALGAAGALVVGGLALAAAARRPRRQTARLTGHSGSHDLSMFHLSYHPNWCTLTDGARDAGDPRRGHREPGDRLRQHRAGPGPSPPRSPRRVCVADGEFDAGEGWDLDAATSMMAWLRTQAAMTAGDAAYAVRVAKRQWKALAEAELGDDNPKDEPESSLHLSSLLEGRWRLDGDLGDLDGEMLATALA